VDPATAVDRLEAINADLVGLLFCVLSVFLLPPPLHIGLFKSRLAPVVSLQDDPVLDPGYLEAAVLGRDGEGLGGGAPAAPTGGVPHMEIRQARAHVDTFDLVASVVAPVSGGEAMDNALSELLHALHGSCRASFRRNV